MHAALQVASLLLTLSLPHLPGQQETRPPARTPHVVLDTVGPAGWRARLGPTNVGTLLASEEGRELWQPYSMQMFGMWRALVGDDDAFAAAERRLLDFDGGMRLAARFDADGPTGAVLVVHGDERTDLDALATDLRQLIERSGSGEWRDVDAAGSRLSCRIQDGMAVSAPQRDGDRLWLATGREDALGAAVAMRASLDAIPFTIARPTPDTPALQLTFDIDEMIPATIGDDGEDLAIATALGFMDIDSLTVALGAAGPQIRLDVTAQLKPGARGLVAAFAPASQGISVLHRLLPEDASGFKIGRFDCGALVRGIFGAVAADMTDGNEQELRDDVEEAIGIDLEQDLLRHMTDELIVFGSPFENFDRRSEATWMFAFRLKDEAAFAQGFATMMEHANPFLSRAETVEVGDVQLLRYGSGIVYDIWMAAGNGVFLMAGGRDAEELATDLLVGAGKLESTEPLTVEQAWFDNMAKRYAPPGCHGVAEADLNSALRIPGDWWTEIVDMARGGIFGGGDTIDPEEAAEHQERFRALLQQHGLLRVRTATGRTAQAWTWRLLW